MGCNIVSRESGALLCWYYSLSFMKVCRASSWPIRHESVIGARCGVAPSCMCLLWPCTITCVFTCCSTCVPGGHCWYDNAVLQAHNVSVFVVHRSSFVVSTVVCGCVGVLLYVFLYRLLLLSLYTILYHYQHVVGFVACTHPHVLGALYEARVQLQQHMLAPVAVHSSVVPQLWAVVGVVLPLQPRSVVER